MGNSDSMNSTNNIMGMGNSDGMNSINDMSYGDNSLILKC
jgi:hypothetical protein